MRHSARRARVQFSPRKRSRADRDVGIKSASRQLAPGVGAAILLSVLLAEWRKWWKTSGQRELRELLADNWDPFADEGFRREADDQLAALARHLHEGATLLDVQVFLHDLRRSRWPERMGRKWTGRDRAVAKKVVEWYRTVTGE